MVGFASLYPPYQLSVADSFMFCFIGRTEVVFRIHYFITAFCTPQAIGLRFVIFKKLEVFTVDKGLGRSS